MSGGIKAVQNGVTYNAAGAAHPAPINLAKGELVTLSFTGTATPPGVYSWVLSGIPAGSGSVISSGSSPGPSFIPDTNGWTGTITLTDENLNIYVLDVVNASAAGTPSTGYITTINVRSFGAVGDGVTDDTAALSAAIAAAQAIATPGLVAGARVFVPAGAYNFTSLPHITVGITIEGEGENKSLLRCTSPSPQDFLYFDNTSVARVREIGFINTVDNLTHRAIVMNKCVNFVIEDITISWACTGAGRHKGIGIAVYSTGSHVPPVGNRSAIRNIEHNVDDSHGVPAAVGSRAILMQGVVNFNVVDVAIDGANNIENAEYGLRLEYCSNIRLSGKTFFQGNGTNTATGASISLNNTQECEFAGVHSSSPHSNVHVEEDVNSLHNLWNPISIFSPSSSGLNLNSVGDSKVINANDVVDSVFSGVEHRKRDVRNDKATYAVRASNPTLATVGIQQQSSPLVSWECNSWDTVGLASHSFKYAIQARALAGNPANASLMIQVSQDGGAATDLITLSSGVPGQLTATKFCVSEAAPDTFLSRSAAKTLKLDDGAGGNAFFLIQSGSILTPNGAGPFITGQNASVDIYGTTTTFHDSPASFTQLTLTNGSAAFGVPICPVKRTALTTPVAVTVTDCIIITNLTVAGAVAVTLPAAPVNGQTIIVKDGKRDAGANNVTVSGNGKNIDGAATNVINTNGGRLWIIYDSTAGEWEVIHKA